MEDDEEEESAKLAWTILESGCPGFAVKIRFTTKGVLTSKTPRGKQFNKLLL